MVIDASAVLAYLFSEPGADEVASLLPECCMSTVNLAEVLARVARDGQDPRRVLLGLRAERVEIVPFTSQQATVAASLELLTRRKGLGLGDCACLALGVVRNRPILTADRIWATLELGADIRLVRNPIDEPLQ